jgi:hypothetical protein
MKCSSLIRAFALAVLVNCSFYAPGEGQSPKQDASSFTRIAREILQKWIAQDMHFFVDNRGAARLSFRREAVRAGISVGSLTIKEEVEYLIARLSKAAGVSYELTSRDVNFAIVVDSPINDGDKPNPQLWKRVGLSEELYKIASEQGSWASGCGIYSFGNGETGQVALSIAFADSKLDPARIRDCVIDGTIRAFGLRAYHKSILLSEDGYIQFVALAKALSACERAIGVELLARMNESEQKLKYVECASELIEK